MVDQPGHVGLARQRPFDALPGRVDHYRQAQRLVAPVAAVVQRLPWQAGAQLGRVALDHPDMASQHRMQQLVASPVTLGVRPRGEVLQVDPVGH